MNDMGEPAQKLELVEGGSASVVGESIADPIADPLRTSGKWLSAAQVADLSGVASRVARKVLANGKWHGAEMIVREVQLVRGGKGGKAPQVHVDSLPTELREKWYLQNGIELSAKPDAETGQRLPVAAHQRDARFEETQKTALWRKDILAPLLSKDIAHGARKGILAEMLKKEYRRPDGKRVKVTRATVFGWLKAYNERGLHGLMPKKRSDTGRARKVVTRSWDGLFADRITTAQHEEVGDGLNTYIKSLWASGERGWRAVAEKATTKLIEVSRDLKVAQFDTLPVGRLGDGTRVKSQFGICSINRSMVEVYRDHQLIAIKNKDNAVWQDHYTPRIRRDYEGYLPRDIVVGDVHPVDVMMRRPDGTVVFPKAIAWLDVATNEIHMTFVLLEPGEGIRREHVAQSFEAMVAEWGLPRLLYLDNGSEYSWDEMIGGFTQLSKLTNGAMAVYDLEPSSDVSERVANCREAVLRSRPYNAKGKPKIEGAFGNIEQVFFATLEGWTAGDRMNKKTHVKGKEPVAFAGDGRDFLDAAGTALEWYHKRPQHGRLKGRSPNEVLSDFVADGWGKTVLERAEVLALAFAVEVQRTPDRGRVSYKPRRGGAMYFYDDALLGIARPITLRVPAFNPEFVFCFEGETLLCVAHPERAYGVLEREGAIEGTRRGMVLHRKIAEMRRHCALLSLVEETERHISHMPDAPDAPVAAVVDAGALDRMGRLYAQERLAAAAGQNNADKLPSQWNTGPIKALENFTFAKDDE